MNKKNITILLTILIIPILIYFFRYPVRRYKGDFIHISPFSEKYISNLVKEQCSKCHALPDSSNISQNDWQFTLAYMGLYLGFLPDYNNLSLEVSGQLKNREKLLNHLSKIPAKKVIPQKDWDNIRKYYFYNSKSESKLDYQESEIIETKLFRYENIYENYDPAITLVKAIGNQVYIGTGYNASLRTYSKKGQAHQTFKLKSAPIDIIISGQDKALLTIGDLIGNQINQKTGSLYFFKANTWKESEYRFSRPISFLKQNNSFFVAAFGAYGSGGLFKTLKNGKQEKILNGNGFLRLVKSKNNQIKNFNIQSTYIALKAEDNESFIAFDSQTKESTILRTEQPSSGFTSFQLVDFDNDGIDEIIATAGDNADSGPYNSIKKSHGIYIYKLTKEKMILLKKIPFQGAYFARTSDFDLDGDLDILAGSSYADIRNPLDLVLFENDGKLNFTLKKINAIPGRYTLCELVDVDDDGDMDAIIAKQNLPYKQIIKGKPFTRQFDAKFSNVILLLNQTR